MSGDNQAIKWVEHLHLILLDIVCYWEWVGGGRFWGRGVRKCKKMTRSSWVRSPARAKKLLEIFKLLIFY
jgi:hypothetical protein